MSQLLLDRHAPLYRFWLSGGTIPTASVEAHCDLVYTLFLTGRISEVSPSAIDAFVNWLSTLSMPGWAPLSDSSTMLVHNCAYVFGALNILSPSPAALYEAVLGGRQELLEAIIDPNTTRPIFPAKWAHHNWRVSHWIGGIPSMILSLARSGYSRSKFFADLITPVRDATDKLIDPQTGLFRAYRSRTLQAMFRRLYAIRHDPDLGDVGGIAHILWVDHAMGRRYIALEAVLAQAQALFRQHKPFMESAPYCLDFDVVQIVRTGIEQAGADRTADSARALEMMSAIEVFFANEVPERYSLHKIPGALATYHELALLAESDTLDAVGMPATDIIRRAHWL